MTRCCWKRCRSTEIAVVWLERDLCAKHWGAVCELRNTGHTADEIRATHTQRRGNRRGRRD